MVTRGGVALGELDPKTLECRRIAGLRVAGELVDLDAPCGGYNLTWAFASGRIAMEA
jgi:predicted flavoprotein YhiN